jgi:hypothetical protein
MQALFLGLRGFRQRHDQHAVAELGLGLVGLDLRVERNAPLEAAAVAFVDLLVRVLVLRQCQHGAMPSNRTRWIARSRVS